MMELKPWSPKPKIFTIWLFPEKKIPCIRVSQLGLCWRLGCCALSLCYVTNGHKLKGLKQLARISLCLWPSGPAMTQRGTLPGPARAGSSAAPLGQGPLLSSGCRRNLSPRAVACVAACLSEERICAFQCPAAGKAWTLVNGLPNQVQSSRKSSHDECKVH